jgi:hypothetical protein
VFPVRYEHYLHITCIAVLVTGHGGPQGYETSRFPHFLDNRFTDGSEVLGLTRRPLFIPRQNIFI